MLGMQQINNKQQHRTTDQEAVVVDSCIGYVVFFAAVAEEDLMLRRRNRLNKWKCVALIIKDWIEVNHLSHQRLEHPEQGS